MFEKYFDASLAKKIPNSNEKQFLSLIYRQWWHILYDNAPILLKDLQQNDKDFLENLLRFLGYKCLLNEKIHLYTIDYISNFGIINLNGSIIEELIISYCELWVRVNVSKNQSVLIYSKFNNKFYIGSKSKTLGSSPAVDIFENQNFQNIEDLSLIELEVDFELIEDYKLIIDNLKRYDEIT